MIKAGQVWKLKYAHNKICIESYHPETKSLTYTSYGKTVNHKHCVVTLVPEFFYNSWELVEHPIESITTTDGEMFI
jgi:hypothetical protein